MNDNRDKRFYYTGIMLFLCLCVILYGLARDIEKDNTASTDMATTEPPSTTESDNDNANANANGNANGYFYIKPDGQSRVIGIRELENSELPVPYDFTTYGVENYKDKHFFEVVILDIETDARLKTETVKEVAVLEIISTLDASGIERTYRELEVRYEEGHAVYKHDKQYFVTSLVEPRLYRKYVIYDVLASISPNNDAVNDSETIDVYKTLYKHVYFSVSDKQFVSTPIDYVRPNKNPFTFEGKTIVHKPSMTSVQGPSFSTITEEPRLNQFVLNASSAVVFDRLGLPESVDWLLGDYLEYDDLLVYTVFEEKGDVYTFHPTGAILYFGDYPIAGIQKGMTFKEVEQIIGPQSFLYFTENNEMTYPLSVGILREGFNIHIGFDSELRVSNFFIRIAEAVEGQENQVYESAPNEQVKAFSEDLFKVEGLQRFSDFATGFYNCYFNAFAVTSDGSEPIDIGFYTYDLSKRAPTLISDQPMKMVFELLHDVNPSVITIGKEDGILYKIDLNTYAVMPLSGPNYKHHMVQDGSVIRAALYNDATFLENYGLKTTETIGQFKVDVPNDWNVRYGDYPEGLYWNLANVFSKEMGLDLNVLKGKTVDATVYRLEEGLSVVAQGQDQEAAFKYPSNVVILREGDAIKGAWLTFNTSSIGPSLELDHLEAITGQTFDQWVWSEGLFVMTTSYLPSPDATIHAYFDAIQAGDKQKANACMTPSSFLDSLTTNLDYSKQLYHENFNANNCMAENIVRASEVEIVSYYEPMSIKPIENNQTYFNAMPFGTRIGVEIALNLEWKEPAFNAEGVDTRFAVLEKTPFGWKIEGLGTGR